MVDNTLANYDKPVITEEQLEESLDIWLNDSHPTYKIAGVEILPSEILRRCDPVAYRIALSDQADFLLEDGGIRTYGYTD
jgi:hypothetical protein